MTAEENKVHWSGELPEWLSGLAGRVAEHAGAGDPPPVGGDLQDDSVGGGAVPVDKRTVLRVMAAMQSCGVRFSPPGDGAGEEAGTETPATDEPVPETIDELVDRWRLRRDLLTYTDIDWLRAMAERAAGFGLLFIAHEIIQAGLALQPDDPVLCRLEAITLARLGARDKAKACIDRLIDQGNEDGQTYGVRGRTYKDLAFQAEHATHRNAHLQQAYDAYRKGYDIAVEAGHLADAIYTGINAAFMAYLLQNQDEVQTLTASVLLQCDELLTNDSSADQYWTVATQAEAYLLQGDMAQAETLFTQARQLAGHRLNDLATTRLQARRILQAKPVGDVALADQWLGCPQIVVFAGHMIDRADRSKPRFPADREADAKALIEQYVKEHNVRWGVASGACGSDILFHEAVLANGGQVHLVLPCEDEQLIDNSIAFAGHNWVGRFKRIKEKAVRIDYVSGSMEVERSCGFLLATEALLGHARLLDRQLHGQLTGLTFWDGRPGDGAGGTADAYAIWKRLGCRVVRLWLTDDPIVPVEQPDLSPETDSHRIVTILFTDVVGFSKTKENELCRFLETYLAQVRALMGEYISISGTGDGWCDRVLYQNSWGDGLYFVFRDVADAVNFTWMLRRKLLAINWQAKGFTRDFATRFALHAGVATMMEDPVTGRNSYVGEHVIRASRLEPIAQANEIYATKNFAALAAAHGVDARFEYGGIRELPKQYGKMPVYHMTRPGRTAFE